MPLNTLLYNDTIVEALAFAVRDGGASLSTVPGLVKRVLSEDCWRERHVRVLKQEARFGSFASFVTATPPEGLGTDVRTLRRLCADDAEALDLMDQAEKVAFVQGRRTDLVDNVHEVERPTGNTPAAALRRLRKDRPDLHARVLAGELSPHGAAVEAGFRRRTLSVPLEPFRAAQALRRHFDPDQLAALIAALQEA